MQIRAFTLADQEAVVQLWKDCDLVRPWNDPAKDIARKLSVAPELFVVGLNAQGQLIATIMAGYEGHRGWINYLAVHPLHQRQGHARQLVDWTEQQLMALGCPKLNLQVRSGNHAVIAFYESLGYANDASICMGKRLIADI